MGGWDSVLNASLDRQAQRHSERMSSDMLQRQFLASQYDNIINAPLPDSSADPKAYQDAVDRKAKALEARQKVYSPEHHASLAEHLHGLITGKLTNGQQPPVSAQAPGQPQTTTAQPAPDHPFAHNPAYQGLIDRLKAFKSPEPAKAGPDWQALAAAPSPEQRKGDAAMSLQKEKDASALAVANARGSSARPIHIGDVTPKDAINNIRNLGYEYADENGEPITEAQLSEAPEYMKLVEFRQGGKSFAKLVDQRSKEWNIGGNIYQAGELGKQSPETLSKLGQATSTLPHESVTTATAPGGGQVVTGTTERSTKPTGVTAPTPTPSSGPTLKSRQSPDLSSVNDKIKAANAASAKLNKGKPVSSQAPSMDVAAKGVLPDIGSMTPHNAALATKAQPAITALMGLYGDPQNPQVKSMADFADLANDPHAQKTLGTAFRLLDQQMGEISNPGILATLGNAAGWGNFRAQVEAGVQQKAGSAMTPREKEYFNTAIASMADIIGARAATGQSPARFSVQFMENELPLIGSSSVTDKNSYVTKMDTIGRQIKVGLNAMPDNKRALSYLDNRQKQLAKQGPVSKDAPSMNPRPANVPEGYVLRDGPKGRGWYAPTAK